MSTRMVWAVVSVLALVAVVSSLAGAQVTDKISVSKTGQQANRASMESSVSADGRYVAFASQASNLVRGDANGHWDVFVRDRQTGKVTLCSVASDGSQASHNSFAPAISADGRYVAFWSLAKNLVSNDTNDAIDVFVHDLVTGETTRVSVTSAGQQGNGQSSNPALSADGRYVAFHSFATNLVAGDTNSDEDVFVHDRQTGETTRVSVSTAGVQGNMISVQASISGDGRYVAFESLADNLVVGDTNATTDIFLRDRLGATTTRVSVDSSGAQANANSNYPALSGDGHSVAFESYASNLVLGDTNARLDVFVRNLVTNQTRRASVSTGGTQVDYGAEYPVISDNGQYVVFQSQATNLVPGDTNMKTDIFYRDMVTSKTSRVSVTLTGVQAENTCQDPSLSGNGQVIVFDSFSTNLVPNDTNDQRDTFAAASPLRPVLTWTGMPGLTADGVRPDSGVAGTTFNFKVKLTDSDSDEPTSVQVIIRKDGQPYKQLDMNAGAGPTTTGRIYSRAKSLPAGNYTYAFVAADHDGPAIGLPTATTEGPTVTAGGSSLVAALAAVATPGGGAQVVLRLSAAATVTAEVRNLAGRPVAVVARERALEPGTQTLLWSGLSDAGTAAPAGRYLVWVEARAADGTLAHSVAAVSLTR